MIRITARSVRTLCAAFALILVSTVPFAVATFPAPPAVVASHGHGNGGG